MTRTIQIEHLAPELLFPNPWNSNKVGPENEARLKASLQEFGLYKPIIVRQMSDGTLQILGGEHRWRFAKDLGYATVPVINLGVISDKKAKTLGLADNGQYGEDDALKLSEILRDIGHTDVANLLPYTDEDLAGMFAATSVDLDALGFDETSDDDTPELPRADAPRPTITHELMRLKVPVEDHERVKRLIDKVIKESGFHAEQDSMVAAGMALVVICNAAKDVL